MAAKLRGPDPPDSLQIVGDIRRLELRPGDALAMQFQFPLTDQTVERVLSTLEAKFPGHKCIVMDKGTDLVVVPAAEASAR